MKRTITTLLLLAAALAPTAWAQSAIDQTRPLDARGKLEIENLKGRIEVRAWDRDEVHITGTLGKGAEKLVVEGDARRLTVRVQYPRTSGLIGGRSEPSDLRLTVPLRADLDIESVAADIDVSGVAPAHLSIESVSGNIAAAGAPRKAEIESVSGNLTLTLNSADVEAESVSGNVLLRGRLNGEVGVETVSGRIQVQVNGEQVRELTANTVSGDADVRTALAGGGEIKLESVSGDLSLLLPKETSAQVSGETFSGTLKATGVTIEKRRGPGASFTTRYGNGDGRISLTTFSGNAEVRVE